MNNFLQNFFNISDFRTLLALSLLFVAFYFLSKIKSNTYKMLTALGLGFLFAYVLSIFSDGENISLLKNNRETLWLYEVSIWFGFFNNAFISMLKLMVIPLIFVGLIYSISNIKNNTKFKKFGIIGVSTLLFTTAISAAIGILVGLGMDFIVTDAGTINRELKEVKSLSDVILGLIPSNIISAMNSNSIVGVVIFAVFFGACAYSVGSNAENNKGFSVFSSFVEFIYNTITKMVWLIIGFMPYSIVTMIASTILNNGFASISNAYPFVIAIYISWILVFIMHAFLIALIGLNPIYYFKNAFSALSMAFASRSSAGTLPVTLNCLSKMGVSKETSSFIASISTTLGMNGCAGYYAGLVCVFMLHSLGITLSISDFIIIVLLCVITSFGIAGIPGITIMIISVLLNGLGLESHFALLALILAIDPILDMARTSSNVSGGMVASLISDKLSYGLDKQRFYK